MKQGQGPDNELSRWGGSNCRCRGGGSNDWGFGTRRRGIWDTVALCYDLHLLAKSSEAGADALDNCRYLLAKRAPRPS